MKYLLNSILLLSLSTFSLQAKLFEGTGNIMNQGTEATTFRFESDSGEILHFDMRIAEKAREFEFDKVYLLGEIRERMNSSSLIYNIIEMRKYKSGDERSRKKLTIKPPSLVEYIGKLKDPYNTDQFLHFIRSDNYKTLYTLEPIRQKIKEYQFENEVYIKGEVAPGFEDVPTFYNVIEIRPATESDKDLIANGGSIAPSRNSNSYQQQEATNYQKTITGMLRKSSSRNGGYYLGLSNRQSIPLPKDLISGNEQLLENLLNQRGEIELTFTDDGFRLEFQK